MTKRTRLACDRRGWISVAAAVLFVAVLPASALWSQSKPDRKRLTAAVSVGVARPADQSFRELYGTVQYPFSMQADYEIHRHILVFSGYAHVGRTGRTLETESSFAPASDPIQFGMHSVKLGLLYALPLHRITLLGGGGAGFHFYRETWEAAGVATKGNKTGWIAQGGAECALTRSFSLVSRVEYSRIVIRAKSSMENDASLGRLELSLGLSISLSRLLQK
jgi:opacity protein-like surface antigen